jgi:drug/metabolite transporter (DMT)-like permease
MMNLALILTSTIFGVVGQLMLKRGMTVLGPLTLTASDAPGLVWRVFTTPAVILGLGIYVGATFFWLLALSRVQLTYAYPFASLSYVLIVLAAWLTLGEHPSPLRLGGMVVIMAGVLLISQT